MPLLGDLLVPLVEAAAAPLLDAVAVITGEVVGDVVVAEAVEAVTAGVEIIDV